MKYIGVSTPAWTILGDKKRGEYKDLEAYDGAGPHEFNPENADTVCYDTAPRWTFRGQKNSKTGGVESLSRGIGKKLDSNPKNLGPGSYETEHFLPSHQAALNSVAHLDQV